MLVSLNWLSEYVTTTLTPKELAERLTTAGVHVEKVVQQGESWEGVRVGKVLDVKPHPNADRLRLVTVDVGSGDNPTVVCGAPNVAVGQKIAFASVGAKLLDGHTGEPSVLKAATIRGVESAGMVCSERELGLSEAHEGILELDAGAPVGEPLQSVIGDAILDIEVTPNRPDHMSMLGIAWEAGAQTRTKVREPERVYAETATTPASGRTSVTIEDKDLGPRYIAGIVERVKLGPSPKWMQERLTAAGMRPINNIVDITNYVMLETGQPLHAFDFRKLGGGQIIVRRAREGERMTTLDGVARALTTDMLVIADANKPIAIAGVMGGADAEVGEGTTMILLEAANFEPTSIRRTSTALNLRTEASIRFEKGLHPELANVASRRAMKLFVELCGGRAAKGLVDAYPNKRADTRVVVTRERITRVLGFDMSTTQTRNALTDLGFGCRWVPPDRYVVRAPYWRTDIAIADDVIEELARVYGYDKIESLPLAGAVPPPNVDPLRDLREKLRDAAVAAGLQEVITYPLTTPEMLMTVAPAELMEVHPPLRLENPMSSDASVMRNSLRASVLQTVAANLRRERGTVAVFECARAYLSRPDDLPQEREMFVGAVAGMRLGRWGEPTSEAVDFFDAKGVLEEVFERVGAAVEFRTGEEFALMRSRTAAIYVGEDRAGVIGEVHPGVASKFEIDGPVFIFEADIERLMPAIQRGTGYTPLSRFPAVLQDLAVLVDASVPAAKVMQLIATSALVTDVKLFDVFEGAPLPEGKRSLAFQVQFQSPDKTLTDTDVAEARSRIIRRLQHELSAELRGA